MGYRSRLTEQFYQWELRGRGWHLFEAPVQLEPVLEPFLGHFAGGEIIDDGLRPNWWQRLLQAESSDRLAVPLNPSPSEVMAYESAEADDCIVFKVSVPRNYSAGPAAVEQLLTMLALDGQDISFELVATDRHCTVQFACRPAAAYWLTVQIHAYLPDCAVMETEADALLAAVENADAICATDFGLAEEFMRPISLFEGKGDNSYAALFGIIDYLKQGEAVILQALFCGTRNPWAESIMNSVTDCQGGSFFYDAPEMPNLARAKTAHPLACATLRIAAIGASHGAASSLMRHCATAVRQASRSPSNELVEIPSPEYPLPLRLADMLLRQSRRAGMVLNVRELSTFAHIPSASLSRKLAAGTRTTKRAPSYLSGGDYLLGTNEHNGRETPVGIDAAQRTRHVHLIGGSGTGKSTLLHSLIAQDIRNGRGCCVIDPHGDLIESLLNSVPAERIPDVVMIDPSDGEYPISLNLLSASSDLERELLASDLVSLFKRFSTSWGDNLNSVLANAIMAFLYNTQPGHLGELRRFLIEPAYRTSVLKTCSDHQLQYYWRVEYPLLKTSSIGSILTRLDSFLRPRVIRNMVCQHRGLDFSSLMDGGKIILVKLSQGLIGAENSYLLGACIIAKLQQSAMARQQQLAEDRVPFFCYIDEFHHFVTDSMVSILSGARKYNLGLVLAHQDMQQVQRYDANIASAIMSNVGTRVCFRLSDTDARRMQEGFSGFSADDLQSLGIGEAVARVNTSDADFSLSVMPTDCQFGNRNAVIEHSRSTYGVSVMKQAADITQQSVAVQTADEEPIMALPYTEEIVRPQNESTAKQKEVQEHRYLQNFIKSMAEQHGYRASIEVPTPDGRGKVDVALERGEERIAVEVSVSTGAEWELHNVQKCLGAGYTKVAVCSGSPKKLQDIRQRIQGSISTSDQALIALVTPEEIASLFAEAQPQKAFTTMKGYRVTVKYDESAGDPAKAEIIKRIIKNKK